MHRKWQVLEPFLADVSVIQECDNPALTKDDAYRTWAGNPLWGG
ncbi:unnamed protein product [Pararhodospirillum photometricum DSM 122]|uniref:Uncharacterized protein n=1 Tax=Pararhodospirillum photometricum DSM 122 TaxID=1150469 RepID=H6SQW5_PARPM|nr:unnamed protein product [Pararhodospirillum photometricum DSM 122]